MKYWKCNEILVSKPFIDSRRRSKACRSCLWMISSVLAIFSLSSFILFSNSVISFFMITTGGPDKLCDRLYFEFIVEMNGNVENPRIIILDCDKYSHLTSE